MQFPFGHGLSYTRFGYGRGGAPATVDVNVSFTLSNTGERTGRRGRPGLRGPLPPACHAAQAARRLGQGQPRSGREPARHGASRVQVPVLLGPGCQHRRRASAGRGQHADPPPDPASQNTDGHWVTPSGRVTLSIGSSVRTSGSPTRSPCAAAPARGQRHRRRRLDTAAARWRRRRRAAQPAARAAGPQVRWGAGPHGPAGPPGPAGKVVCRNTTTAQVLCTLLFPDGAWESSPAAARGCAWSRAAARSRRARPS